MSRISTAGLCAMVGAAALIAAGCGHKTDADHAVSSASSAASSAGSAASSAALPPSSSAAAAPSSTKIPGKNGTEYTIEGPILTKWESLNDAAKKDLGAPFDNQKNTANNTGVYQQYDGGVLIYKTGGPVYFVWGKIRDAWNDNQASQGKLGYPSADEITESDGSFKSTFEHGTITFKPGDDKAIVTVS